MKNTINIFSVLVIIIGLGLAYVSYNLHEISRSSYIEINTILKRNLIEQELVSSDLENKIYNADKIQNLAFILDGVILLFTFFLFRKTTKKIS